MGSTDRVQLGALRAGDDQPVKEAVRLCEDAELLEDVELVEVVWIDGMCGVY